MYYLLPVHNVINICWFLSWQFDPYLANSSAKLMDGIAIKSRVKLCYEILIECFKPYEKFPFVRGCSSISQAK